MLEGLTVGSTNRININKTKRKGQDNFYETMDLNIKLLNPNKVYNTRVLMDSLRFDKSYVKQLNNWESKISRVDYSIFIFNNYSIIS